MFKNRPIVNLSFTINQSQAIFMNSSTRKYIAELIGTFVLVFYDVGAAIFTGGDLVATALAFGLTVVVMSVTPAYALTDDDY